MAALGAVATVGYIGVRATADTHDVLSRALLAQRSAGIAAQRLSETEQIAKTVLAMTRLRDPSEYLPAYDDAANDVQRAMTAIRDARLSEDIAEDAGKSLLALNKWVSATRIAISGETATSLPTTDVLNRWRADVSTRVAALADQVNGAAETIASQVDSRSRWE
ncbi:MAG: hypothetical protein ACR2PM_11800, partial [Hyphomicrobiales bacterium]